MSRRHDQTETWACRDVQHTITNFCALSLEYMFFDRMPIIQNSGIRVTIFASMFESFSMNPHMYVPTFALPELVPHA